MDREIERKANELRRQITREQEILLPGGSNDPVDLLDPSIAAKALHIDLRYVSGIGQYGSGGNRFEVAGLLDRRAKTITISQVFKAEIMRFTAAHEIGHFLLHPHLLPHRDRPISSSAERRARPTEEVEADRFAANFLMPNDILVERFEMLFATKKPFVFDDATAFHLRPDNPDSLFRHDQGVLDRATALATARSFNGRHFVPLWQQFHVSISAMAYRLMEIQLIETGNPTLDGALSYQSAPEDFAPLFREGFHPISEMYLVDIFVDPFLKRDRRLELVKSLKRFISFLRNIGVPCEIWLDGSFTTEKPEPDDIDVVVFFEQEDVRKLSSSCRKSLDLLQNKKLMRDLYDCDVYYDPPEQFRKQYWVDKFGKGRTSRFVKGIPVICINQELPSNSGRFQ